MDVVDAHRLYTDLRTSARAWLGGRPAVELQDVDRLQIKERVGAVVADVQHGLNGSSYAPSCWHAAVYLFHLQDYWMSAVPGNVRQALVFRGHADAAWPLTPALQRAGVDRTHEARVLDVFARIVDQFYDRQLFTDADLVPICETAPSSNTATAQHFGVPTDLLDFTTDPAVAVRFSCDNVRLAEDRLATVYAVPFRMAIARGARVILPHPYVQRLYLQRGVFIDMSATTPALLTQICLKLRFPRDATFQVVREYETIDLLPPDPWFEGIVQRARTWAASRSPDNIASDKINELFDELGFWPSYLHGRRQMIIDMFAELWSMLLGLASTFHVEGYRIDRPVLDAIVNQNGPLIRSLLHMYERAKRRLSDTDGEPHSEALAAALNASLEEHSIGRIQ